MLSSRFSIMIRLVPLLARLEGRVGYSYNYPAAFLHSTGSSCLTPTPWARGRRSGSSGSSCSGVSRSHSVTFNGNTRRSASNGSSERLFQQRRSYVVPGDAGRSAGRWTTAVRAFSSGNEESPTPAPSSTGLSLDDARETLKSLFGHDSFRDGQEGVVEKLLAGESCAGIFPTGAGKSICYQLPGTLMAREGLGLTLVVSPLIALMKDQTDALNAAGVPCAKLDSTLEAHEVLGVYEQIREGTIALLYVSPERFNNERFVKTLKGIKVALFVVDEAHCISEWGHNFRPDYLRLADFAKAAKANACLALTATATPRVTDDIADRLNIPPSNVRRTPFYRPMLRLGAVLAPDDAEERVKMLAGLLLKEAWEGGGATVVYVTLQKTAVEVAQALVAEGFDARPYHAGLPLLQREETQDWFMSAPGGTSPVVVGTIAFGMGLDKKNVRRVVHYNMPKSPEDLAQQVGRAGRDGKYATCTTLVSAADLPLLRSMIYGGTPSEAAVRGLLQEVFAGGEDEISFSFYDLSQALDTKDLVLKTLVAHLQVNGLIRELTSYFETADVHLLDAGNAILNDGTEKITSGLPREWLMLLGLADAALKNKRKNAKWATLKVDETAEVLGVPKQQIASILSGMSFQGLIELGKPGKIRSRFLVLRRPASRDQAQALINSLHTMAIDLQDREIGRLDRVLEILCSAEGTAVSSGLSKYFGDSDETVLEAMTNERATAAVADAGIDATATPGGAGHEAPDQVLSGVLTLPEVSEQEIDELWRVGVLDLLVEAGGGTGEDGNRVIPCDDAYLLARFAAGIRSPRIGKLKLAQLGSFGCCAHCAFPALLARAEEAVASVTAAATSV